MDITSLYEKTILFRDCSLTLENIDFTYPFVYSFSETLFSEHLLSGNKNMTNFLISQCLSFITC